MKRYEHVKGRSMAARGLGGGTAGDDLSVFWDTYSICHIRMFSVSLAMPIHHTCRISFQLDSNLAVDESPSSFPPSSLLRFFLLPSRFIAFFIFLLFLTLILFTFNLSAFFFFLFFIVFRFSLWTRGGRKEKVTLIC